MRRWKYLAVTHYPAKFCSCSWNSLCEDLTAVRKLLVLELGATGLLDGVGKIYLPCTVIVRNLVDLSPTLNS